MELAIQMQNSLNISERFQKGLPQILKSIALRWENTTRQAMITLTIFEIHSPPA